MADPRVVIEGEVKHRDARKWRPRWCVLTKLSPVADCLHLQLYRDSKERCKNGPTKASLSLERFLGMESGFTLDKESNTMAILCNEMVVLLAFDTREMLIQWQVKIKTHVPEAQQFLVQMTHLPARSKLTCGPARLHIQDRSFCLASGMPPRLSGIWPIQQLRKYGLVEGKFCFEGGSLCGRGEGLHVLHTNQTEELAKAFELASQGKLEAKRKAAHKKNQTLEGPCRMSMQPKCSHKSREQESNESSRPLLSSGSEGSICDACSEIIRFTCSSNGDVDLSSDDAYSTKSTCCTTLRWSSTSSCGGGGPAYVSAVSLVGENGCSASSLSVLNSGSERRSVAGMSGDCSTLPKPSNENRCSWTFALCSNCGRHYCLGPNGPSCECAINCPTISNRTISSNTISTLVSDFRASSPASSIPGLVHNCARHNHHGLHNGNHIHQNGAKPGAGTLSDRTSLCSQSSHSSGTSSGSSGSGSAGYQSTSEYSVPRGSHSQAPFVMDMLYDRPKNVQHSCSLVAADKRASLNENTAPICTCQMMGVNHVPVNGHPKLRKSSTINSYSSEGSCGSPSTSPKKGLRSDDHPFPCNNNPWIGNANGNGTGAGPGSGIANGTGNGNGHGNGSANNPYMHYQIPRTALANIYLKEMQAQKAMQQQPYPQPSLTGEMYDVPKKYKDAICDAHENCNCSSTPLQPRNGAPLFNREPIHCNLETKSINGSRCLGICRRRRSLSEAPVTVAGNCCPEPGAGRREDLKQCSQPNHFHSQQRCSESSERQSKSSFSPVIVSSAKSEHLSAEGADNGPKVEGKGSLALCRDSDSDRQMNCKQNIDSTSSQSNGNPKHNYINIDFSPSSGAPVSPSSLPSLKDTTHNYVNMQFVQSIDLYENMDFSRSKAPPAVPEKRCQRKEREQSPFLSKRPENILPKRGNGVAGNGSNNGYEMMNFGPKKLPPSEDDYLIMQRVARQVTTGNTHPFRAVEEDLARVAPEVASIPNSAEKGYSTSLRPFLPILLARLSQGEACLRDGPHKSRSRPSTPQKSSRSGSFSDFKRKILFRTRSSSSDGRKILNKPPLAEDMPTSCPSSPAMSSIRGRTNRRAFIFSKMNWRSKEKSMSTENISPPTSVASTPRCNRSMESLHHMPFHRSADCLKIKVDDYRSSEEDLCTSSQITVLCASPLKGSPLTAIKRSISVPCKQKHISALARDQVERDPAGAGNNSPTPRGKSNDSTPGKGTVGESKHLPDSTSSSDMSDYMSIETLSLSSRTSSGSNSSDPYARSDDLVMTRSPPRAATTLKPRSSREYLTVEREIVPCIGCTGDRSDCKTPTPSLHSPSPGYGSASSPPPPPPAPLLDPCDEGSAEAKPQVSAQSTDQLNS